MQYRDSHERPQRLTPVQGVYLSTVSSRGGFDCGWGGLASTRTVRLLEERGLITLRRGAPGQRPYWRVTGFTTLGRSVYARWAEERAAEIG